MSDGGIDMTMMAIGGAIVTAVGTTVAMALFSKTDADEEAGDGTSGFEVEEPAAKKKAGKKDKKKAKKAKKEKAAPAPEPEPEPPTPEASEDDEPEPEKPVEVKEEPAKKKKKKKAKKAKVAEPKKEEPKKVDTAAARKLEKQIEKQKKKAEKAAERAAKGEAPKESSGGGWTTVPTYVSTKPAPVVVVAADGSAPVAPRLEIDLGDCVGKIIGRKGANIQLIQETSGAKVDLDKQSSLATITGSAEAVAEAARQINLVLDLEGSKTSGTIQVPKDMHRKIIGQGFQGIKDIQAATNTRIEVPKPDDPSDIITIAGQTDSINQAKTMIMQKLAKFSANNLTFPYGHYPLGADGVLRLFLGNKGEKLRAVTAASKADIKIDREKAEFIINGEESAYVRDAFTMISETLTNFGKVYEFKVDDARMGGRIIGAGGAQIRNLEGKSGAQIDRVDSLNFKITGTADAVAKCKAMVDLVLSGEADDIFLKPGEIKKDDFSVPRAAVGTIIGQKGAKIRELEETTGANIRVDRGAQSDPTQVKIFGKPACVAAAVTAIEAIVKEVNATVSSKAQTAEQLAAMQQLTGEEFNADVFTENSNAEQSWGTAADGDDADAW